MAMKLRRALDMSGPGELLEGGEIPLDPGLSDVAYQPGQGEEGMGGLLDAAQQGRWKNK